jgi:hypothetical protein
MTDLIDDSQRLAMIQALGAICVRCGSGQMSALFDNESQVAAFEDANVVITGPRVEARSCDVDRLGLKRGDSLEVSGKPYRVVQLLPDSYGFTVVGIEEA